MITPSVLKRLPERSPGDPAFHFHPKQSSIASRRARTGRSEILYAGYCGPGEEDDDIRDPDDQYGAAKAARVSSQRSRCLCRHASKPGSNALPCRRPHAYPCRSLEDHDRFSGELAAAWIRDVGLRKSRHEQICGSIGIFQPLDWPEPELAHSLNRPFWGQGFATEAATAARDWLFGHFPLPRLASFIRPDNYRSIGVAERLGAVCEGTVELRGSTVEHWVHYPAGRADRME
jgi:RimJ/RimL family protein N-acetyltransferase